MGCLRRLASDRAAVCASCVVGEAEASRLGSAWKAEVEDDSRTGREVVAALGPVTGAVAVWGTPWASSEVGGCCWVAAELAGAHRCGADSDCANLALDRTRLRGWGAPRARVRSRFAAGEREGDSESLASARESAWRGVLW